MRIAAMGEDRLIRLISSIVKPRGHVKVGIGDDCCVLADGTVLTTDCYADGVHFVAADRPHRSHWSWMSYSSVGVRCACACLSDVVAMAARPGVLLVGLAVPKSATSSQVSQLYRGIESVCAVLGCEVAGGDIIAMDRLVLCLSATGRTDHPRLRSACRAGDSLYVTGSVGASETGRLALLHRLGARSFRDSVARHRLPMPRLRVALKLAGKVHGLIDTSDGIATDARHLAEMSRVRITIEAERLPVSDETRELCSRLRLDPVEFSLSSGEDYELLFTSSHRIPKSVNDVRVSRIGSVARGNGLYLTQSGRTRPLKLSGYDHLRGS